MGLDMYMYRHNKGDFDDERVEVAYWRKHNALHGFLNSLQPQDIEDLEIVPLSKDNLEEILDLSKAIMRKDLDPELSMPTFGGFFFGTYEYDDWYYNRTQDTIDQIEKILKETDFEKQAIYYQAWW